MDKEQKAKLEELKQTNAKKKKYGDLQNNILFQECLAALKIYKIVDNEDEVNRIVHLASLSSVEMYSHNDLIDLYDEEQYFIVWDDSSVPVVESSGQCIKESWDDVMAVSFDTYFVAKSSEKAIIYCWWD